MFPYIGGKSHHIKHLDEIFPIGCLSLVDVFGGAGWVSVKTTLPVATRVYNDYNSFLALIFQHMSQDPMALADKLESWPQHDPVLYRQFQQEIFDGSPAMNLDTAAKYLYLQVQSYSGNTLSLKSSIYFTPLKTPASVIKKLRTPRIQNRLKSLTVENLDCCEVIRRYDGPNTFFYVDPPYYSLEHYYTKEFGREQHKILADTLKSIQGKFALSYYEFPELLTWFPQDQFQYHCYSVSKQNSSKTNKTKGQELVITNY